MQNLLDEMQQCKSVNACIELAMTDAYVCSEPDKSIDQCVRQTFLGDEQHVCGYDLYRIWPGPRNWWFGMAPGRRQSPWIVDCIFAKGDWPDTEDAVFACRARPPKS